MPQGKRRDGKPPLFSRTAVDDREMRLRLVMSGPVVLAGDIEPHLDLLFSLTLPRRARIHSDRVIHRLVPADCRPEIRRNRDPNDVLGALDNLVTDLDISCPICLLAPMVL